MACCLQNGQRTAPRGVATLELLPVAFTINDPRRRYVSLPPRRWSIVYAIGELCWHLRGSSLVDEIAYYASRWRTIAGNATEVTGSNYGAKIFKGHRGAPSQWSRVINQLRIDRDSRRAVLYFSGTGEDTSSDSKDIACAVSLQFLIRDGKLDAIANMRSNDAMLGLPYDVFLFSMLQEMAANSLGVDVGKYNHVAGSLHLYESDLLLAKDIISSRASEIRPMPRMEGLSALPSLLEGEAELRTGRLPLIANLQSEYWSALLAVLAAWKGGHDLNYKPLALIEDSVLANLYSLRQ
ncbi:thymidylate synthase [Ralstonia solanacearum]|uniref:thymidylate synthase n=1 Tax=Ralstonia solanacearum TaxID=305 RepID=UPI000181691C|nr:thymidylate synthase [Ralstonia solanacearum]MDC6178162.1 thymidylate synthase [Ralstonia solanacearum]MDC6210852.1 thymidylate synthase [Ralstonia solanacearum]MDC6238989.1 thymidylate synthase [Ralstonia solanacearum]MDD7800881.1 thymidylate synthase [Ralstonia solanacearum]